MVESAADRLAFLADFGVSATYGGNNTKVLIQAKHDLSAIFDGPQTTDYLIEAPAESVAGVVRGHTIAIGGINYTIVAVMPDGTGWVEMLAEKQ